MSLETPPNGPDASPLVLPFRASGADAFCSGEILSRVVDLVGDRDWSSPDREVVFDAVEHPYAIILSQGCDLAQDYLKAKKFEQRARPENNAGPDRELPSILFCEMMDTDTFLALNPNVAKSLTQQKDTTRNQKPRYHFLPRVEPDRDALGHGLPELVIDFKRYFALETTVAYRQLLGQAKRRAVLNSPFLEHLTQRFASYFSRVGLPVPYASG